MAESGSAQRKAYIRENYSAYWLTARKKIYGVTPYDKLLMNYVHQSVPASCTMLEVAVGTGDPFADEFQKRGHEVYGIDLAENLIEECRRINSNIHAQVGDAEAMPYPDATFGLVYCFHSSWYFPDPLKAISEMIRVAAPGGGVMIDFQNAANAYIARAYDKRLMELKCFGLFRIVKNIAKMVLRRGTPNWKFVVHEVPTDPQKVEAFLKGQPIKELRILGSEDFDTLEDAVGGPSYEKYPRLIFVFRKA